MLHNFQARSSKTKTFTIVNDQTRKLNGYWTVTRTTRLPKASDKQDVCKQQWQLGYTSVKSGHSRKLNANKHVLVRYNRYKGHAFRQHYQSGAYIPISNVSNYLIELVDCNYDIGSDTDI